MKPLKPCLGLPGRPCSDLTRDASTRCDRCRSEWNRQRNARRPQYAGDWRARSKAARKEAGACNRCGRTDDLTLDHETNTVECRSCNSSHRRNPTWQQQAFPSI